MHILGEIRKNVFKEKQEKISNLREIFFISSLDILVFLYVRACERACMCVCAFLFCFF